MHSNLNAGLAISAMALCISFIGCSRHTVEVEVKGLTEPSKNIAVAAHEVGSGLTEPSKNPAVAAHEIDPGDIRGRREAVEKREMNNRELKEKIRQQDDTIKSLVTELAGKIPLACVGTYKASATHDPRVEFDHARGVFRLFNEYGQREEGKWDPSMRILLDSGAAVWFEETATLAIYMRANGTVRYGKK